MSLEDLNNQPRRDHQGSYSQREHSQYVEDLKFGAAIREVFLNRYTDNLSFMLLFLEYLLPRERMFHIFLSNFSTF